MQRSLAASSIECAQLLNILSSLLHDPHSRARSNLEQAAIEDQYGRFNIWAGNLGAFQRLPAKSSLDHRLRESLKLATQIQELLQDLYDALQSIHAIASGEKPNRQYDADEEDEDEDEDEDENEDETVHENADKDRGPKEEDDELSDSEARHITPCSEAEELFKSVKETIASLFRMSIIIRKASPRDRFARAQSSRQAPFDESFDIKHVAQKHPLLDSEGKLWLKERLGKAITQRRQYLRYAREHRNKLSKDVSDLWQPGYEQKQTPAYLAASAMPMSQGGQTNTTKPTSTLAPTAASTLFFANIQMSEKDSADNRSQTSYALSLGDKEDDLQLQFPRLVDVAQGSSTFECPLCWNIQSIQSESSWRKHAFSDLRPYLCTFKECDLKFFSERGDWFDHEMQHHRAKWHCHFCERDDFRSREKFNKHLRQHDVHASEDQLSALSEASKRSVENLPASDCPFCNEWEPKLRQANPEITQSEEIVVTPTQFRQHVGSHMQQLALFAIPRGHLEDDADESSIASVAAAGVAKESLLSLGTPIASLPSVSSRQGYAALTRTASEMLRIDSFDGVEHERVLQGAFLTSTTAFKEEVIRVFPSLLPEECGILRSHFDMDNLRLLPGWHFSRIAYFTSLGQWSSDAYWLAECDLFGEQWWEIVVLILSRWTKPEIRKIRQALPECWDSYSVFMKYLQDCCDKMDVANTKKTTLAFLLQYGRIGTTTDGDRCSRAELADQHAILVAWLEAEENAGNFKFLFKHLLSKSDLYLRRLVEFGSPDWGPEQLCSRVKSLYGHELMTLVKHVIYGAVNAPARDARNLDNTLHALTSIEDSVEQFKLTFLAVELHWNVRYLRKVKREFKRLYGHDIETSIERYTTGDYGTFLLRLMNVDEDTYHEKESMLDEPEEVGFLGVISNPSEDERTERLGERKISNSETANKGSSKHRYTAMTEAELDATLNAESDEAHHSGYDLYEGEDTFPLLEADKGMAARLETTARHNSTTSRYELESARELLLKAAQISHGDVDLIYNMRELLKNIQSSFGATGALSMSEVLNTPFVEWSGNESLPLLEAAKSSDVKAATVLLSYGADVNAALSNGDTAFIVALRFYNFSFIDYLLEHGANEPDVETTSGMQWYEAYKKQRSITTESEQEWWHLIGETSACGGQEGADRIRELLSTRTTLKSMVDLSLPKGWTALHYAVVHGNIENADVLIDNCASLWFQCDQRPSGQESVLEVALFHERQRFVGFLLKKGLDEGYVQGEDQKEEFRKLVTSIEPKFLEWDMSMPREHIKVLSRSLFVGDVGGTESEIRSIFGRFGNVQNCIINQEKRHAFVKMFNRRDAISAKEGMDSTQDINALSKARRTRWAVGFGPRDCSDYTTGVSIIPIARLTKADRNWVLRAKFGGTGGRKLEGGMVIEEPDIEISAGVFSESISGRVLPEAGSGNRGSRDRGGNEHVHPQDFAMRHEETVIQFEEEATYSGTSKKKMDNIKTPWPW